MTLVMLAVLAVAGPATADAALTARVEPVATPYHEDGKALELDPHFTAMRVGLAKTLIRRGRVTEARRELERVLAESAPSNPANFTVQDVPAAKRILDSTRNP
jgi:uroporphyrinogen-III synthase